MKDHVLKAEAFLDAHALWLIIITLALFGVFVWLHNKAMKHQNRH